MNARTKDAPTPKAAGLWLTTKAAPMFDLSARYSIDAGASLPDLLRDGHSLLSSALGVLRAMELTDDGQFAVLHLLRQADAIIGLADDMAEQLQLADKMGGAA